MNGVDDEAEPGQLVLALPLGLIIACRRRSVVVVGVVIEVAERCEEGMLQALAFLRYIFLSASLSNPPFDLCLLEVYSRLSLRLPESCLPKKCLFFLG